jgi:hypothetical protein
MNRGLFVAKIKLDPKISYFTRSGDGFFYIWFNPDRVKRSASIKTIDELGDVYQHSLEDIKNGLHSAIQKSSSPVIFNPVNTRSFSGLPGFLLACICSIAVETCFIIIGAAYRICNRTQIYPFSFFRRHAVDITNVPGFRKGRLFHIISSPNVKLSGWATITEKLC